MKRFAILSFILGAFANMDLEKVVITQIDVWILMNVVPFLTFANKDVPTCGDLIDVIVVQDIA